MTNTCACWPATAQQLRNRSCYLATVMHLELAHPDVVDWLMQGHIDEDVRLDFARMRRARRYMMP